MNPYMVYEPLTLLGSFFVLKGPMAFLRVDDLVARILRFGSRVLQGEGFLYHEP